MSNFAPMFRDLSADTADKNIHYFLDTILNIRNDIKQLQFHDDKSKLEHERLISDLNDIRIEVYRKAMIPSHGYLLMSCKLDWFVANVYQPYVLSTTGRGFIDEDMQLYPIGEA